MSAPQSPLAQTCYDKRACQDQKSTNSFRDLGVNAQQRLVACSNIFARRAALHLEDLTSIRACGYRQQEDRDAGRRMQVAVTEGRQTEAGAAQGHSTTPATPSALLAMAA